ncbi:MAG TPA: Hsp20/alpha crystallin family protein [Sphingobacterium sp.]|nr:Hsp20/alpha crystallin family protein [Sphingobacterium sp.]
MFKQNQYTGQHKSDTPFCADRFRTKLERLHSQLFDGGAPFAKGWGADRYSAVPVNIIEHQSCYELKLYAAGRKKEYFQVSVDNDVLSVVYRQPKHEQEESYIVQEYAPSSFERSFQLREQMLRDNIHASFEEGVLTIVLPKDPEVVKQPHSVRVD